MFILNDDMSIYVTRGDMVAFNVGATDQNGNAYVFKPGDVVRFKVVEKKNYDNVVLQRDLAVEAETTVVSILLEEKDTRIGDVISKPVDYWYEIELNPFTNPQTIVGYDDYGAKIFKLLPEGKSIEVDITEDDIPVVDSELSLTSERPIQNQAVTRALLLLEETVEETETRVLSAVETVEAFDEEIAEIKAGIQEVNSKLNNKASASDLVPLSEILHRQNNAIWLGDYKVYGEDSYVYQDKDIWNQLVNSIEAVNDVVFLPTLTSYLENNHGNIGTLLNKLYAFRLNNITVPASLDEILSGGHLATILAFPEAAKLLCSIRSALLAVLDYDSTILSNDSFRTGLENSILATTETKASGWSDINSVSEAKSFRTDDIVLVNWCQTYATVYEDNDVNLYDSSNNLVSSAPIDETSYSPSSIGVYSRITGLKAVNNCSSGMKITYKFIDLEV